MNLKKQLIFNTAIIALGKLSTQVISFLLLPLYTAFLTPEEYGIYDFLNVLALFLMPIVTLLMEESMFRFLIDVEKEEEKEEVISTTFIYILKSVIIISIIWGILNFFIRYDYTFVLYLYVITTIIKTLLNAFSRGIGNIKVFSFSNFLSGIIVAILNVIFIAIIKMGVNGLLWSTIISNVITSIIVSVRVKVYKYVSIKKVNKDLTKKMIKYSIPLIPNSLSWTIINLSDRLIITNILGTTANGIYSIANKFPTIINTLYGFFYTAWQESSAKILKEENSVQYYNSIYKDLKKFMLSITILLISVMPIAFKILINEQYNDAYVYIPILILAMYYSNMSGFYGGIFSAYKNTKIMGVTTIIAAIINIIINLMLIKSIGLYAAVISTLIANLIIYIYRRIALKKYIVLEKSFLKIGWGLFILECIFFYNNKIWITLLGIVIAMVYSISVNKKILKSIFNSIKNKLLKT